MARATFGGGAPDFAIQAATVGSSINLLQGVGTAAVSMWTAQTGGTQITDLQTIGGGAITTVTSNANGSLPQFLGPATGITSMWADAGGGFRFRVNSDPGLSYSTITSPRWFTGDVTFYVSPSGNDSNTGLAQGEAFATIAHAVTTLGATGGRVILSPGNHALSAAVTVPSAVQNLTIEGQGANATQVIVNGNYDAFTLTGAFANVTFKRMWIGSFAARTSGYGINAQGTTGTHGFNLTVEDVVFQNVSQGVLAQYVDRSALNRCQIIQSISSAFVGPAIRLLSSVSWRLRDIEAFTTTGSPTSDVLRLDSDTDTIICDGLEFTGWAGNGINCVNSIGGSSTGPRIVRVHKSMMETMGANGVLVGAARDFRATDLWCVNNVGCGFQLTGGSAYVRGGKMMGNGQHGCYINGAGVVDAEVIDLISSSNSQTTASTYDGIRIEDLSTHVRVRGGRCTNNLDVTYTNSQRYGISVGSNSTNYIGITGVDLAGNATGALGNFSSGADNQIATGANIT